jgi:hypothetical protein
MKVYTSAPAGTRIDIQLGARSMTTYPEGIHSEYTAVTQTVNAWHLLTFSYYQSPTGSSVTATNINKIVVLFHPNSSARDTIFFDDPTGPTSIPLGMKENESISSARLLQNQPNPATDNTIIPLILNSGGLVSLKIYDMLGHQVSTVLDKDLEAGQHNIPVNTSLLPSGAYFYIVNKDGYTQTRKLMITR